MATDWLGQEIEVGDYVVYPAQSGRCAQMTVARIAEFRDNGNIDVEPVQSARWKQHYGRRRFIDKRTGKGIDPSFAKHHAKPAYYTHPAVPDREFATWEELRDYAVNELGYSDWRRGLSMEGSRWTQGYEWHPATYKDYVEEVKVTNHKVTLSANAKSITSQLAA